MSRLPVKLMHRFKRVVAACVPWSELGRRRLQRGEAGGVLEIAMAAERSAAAARAIADARTALAKGQTVRAAMAVQQAIRNEPDHAGLIEMRAHVALAAGRAHEAVEILDHSGADDDRSRLLLALARCQAGDVATATGELGAWVRSGSCPAQAKALLATLHLATGDDAAARRALGATPGSLAGAAADRAVDPLICQMLVLIDLAEDLPVAAEKAAGLLVHAFTHQGFNRRWLATLDLAPREREIEPSHELVEALAERLAAKPELIATLTRAQREEPNRPRIRLIRRAVARLVDVMVHPMAAIESLAELAEIAGDRDDAARWARRGLRVSPFSAKLGLLLDRVTSDDLNQGGGEVLDALERAANRQPGYADVRRALILRYQRSGLAREAERAADRWVKQAPDSPAAAAVRKEIAA